MTLISSLKNEKTGTIVKNNLVPLLGWPSKECIQKVIHYAPGSKSKLAQLGIDTVTITPHRDGSRFITLQRGDNVILNGYTDCSIIEKMRNLVKNFDIIKSLSC